MSWLATKWMIAGNSSNLSADDHYFPIHFHPTHLTSANKEPSQFPGSWPKLSCQFRRYGTNLRLRRRRRGAVLRCPVRGGSIVRRAILPSVISLPGAAFGAKQVVRRTVRRLLGGRETPLLRRPHLGRDLLPLASLHRQRLWDPCAAPLGGDNLAHGWCYHGYLAGCYTGRFSRLRESIGEASANVFPLYGFLHRCNSTRTFQSAMPCCFCISWPFCSEEEGVINHLSFSHLLETRGSFVAEIVKHLLILADNLNMHEFYFGSITENSCLCSLVLSFNFSSCWQTEFDCYDA